MIVLTRSSQSFQTGGQPAYSVQCIGRNCHRLAGSGVGLRHTTPHKISCLRSWWGWGPHDDSTKSWWLGSWLFFINMIIKIIIIIFVIIIIWFRVHGRGESVLCFVRRWEWRAARSNQISEFQDKDTFIGIGDYQLWQIYNIQCTIYTKYIPSSRPSRWRHRRCHFRRPTLLGWRMRMWCIVWRMSIRIKIQYELISE